MNITSRKSQIRTIKQGDKNFTITDGFMMADRAGFEISSSMPYEYKLIIYECLKNKWLKPIASITERELIFMGLTNNQ
jgi:hypothetical protein